TYNRKEKLIRLIKSILKSNYPRNKLEIIVIDDASTDGTYEEVKKRFPEVKIIRNKKEKLVTACRNIGIRKSKGSYIFFIDDDNIVDKNCISLLVKAMKTNPKFGLVGPVSIYNSKKNVIWCAGAIFNIIFGVHLHIKYNKPLKLLRNVKKIYCDYIPNAYMTRKEILKKINYFDQKKFPIAMEEIDLAYRIRHLCYKIAVIPESIVFHDVPLKRDFHITPLRAYFRGRSRVLFYKKYLKYRIIGIFFDILAFLFLIIKYSEKNKRKIFIEYLKGVFNGIASPVYN
ncbi:MAG: glycosyltransferase family 2 protein, partial [Candidatus Aenigmatarchaeota archaeon]